MHSKNKPSEEEESSIIRIVRITSKDRITLPKAVRERLKVEEGDHLVFCEGNPGVTMVKASLEVLADNNG